MTGSSQLILRSSREYAIYVCSTRAIPAIEDGMKNGQRMAMWLLRNRAEKLKTFALSGLLGYERLYVHGEVSANNTISLLAAPYKNNVPLIQGEGAFGSRVSPVDGIGAPRYTEVMRSKAAQALFYTDLDLVPLEENYDGSNVQPKHFLPLIPVVLLNGVSGVAVGWSTEILPRSLKSLIKASQDALAGRKVTGLEPYYNLYDIDVKPLAKNQWEFSGKAKIIDTSTVHITELPPGEKLEKFRERLIVMEDAGTIQRYNDESADSISIFVTMKRGSLAGTPATTVPAHVEMVDGVKFKYPATKVPAKKAWTSETAIEFFKLREKVTERIVLIDWGRSRMKTYSDPEQLVIDYVNWRLGWYTTRYKKYRTDTLYELNYLLALKALFVDKFTARLGKIENRAAIEADVTKVVTKAKLKLDDSQMDRIVSLPTYRWNKEFEASVDEQINKARAEIADYEDILSKPERLKSIYNGELEELKKLKL